MWVQLNSIAATHNDYLWNLNRIPYPTYGTSKVCNTWTETNEIVKIRQNKWRKLFTVGKNEMGKFVGKKQQAM